MLNRRSQHRCVFTPLRTFSNGMLMEVCECGRTRVNAEIHNLDLPFEVSRSVPCAKVDTRKRYKTGTRAIKLAKPEPVLVQDDGFEEHRLWSR